MSEWKYLRFTKDDEITISYRPVYEKDVYEKEGYVVEELKPKRYNDETFKRIVKECLRYTIPLGTTELWHRCLDCELLLTRETFLKRLKQIDDDWLQLDVIGSSYTWSCKDE